MIRFGSGFFFFYKTRFSFVFFLTIAVLMTSEHGITIGRRCGSIGAPVDADAIDEPAAATPATPIDSASTQMRAPLAVG